MNMVAKSLNLDEFVLFLHTVNKYLLLESSVNSVLLSNVFAHVIEHNVRRTKSRQKDENNATLCESFHHLRWATKPFKILSGILTAPPPYLDPP